MNAFNQDEVASLMGRLRQGDPHAAERLVESFYPELRRLAVQRMRGESSSHSWQPTVLVNELYMELRRIKQLTGGAAHHASDEGAAFLALAAHIMKRLLIHHARPLAQRVEKVPLRADFDLAADGEDKLRELDDLLLRLEAINPKLRSVVEMKVWAGFTGEEMAARLGCTTRSVERYWSLARQWLRENYTG